MYELHGAAMSLLSEARFDEQIAVAYHNLPESLQNEFVREFGYDILNSAQQLLMDLEDCEVLNWAADWIEENSSMIWREGILWQTGDLTGANLTYADLTGEDLANADLGGVDLTGAYLGGANLTGADLGGACLTRANLGAVDLTRADLTRADLTRADLTGVDLSYADLTDANLTDANLSYANLAYAVGVEHD